MKHALLWLSAICFSYSVMAQCTAPTGFYAIGGDCTMELHWNNIPEATYYKIKYRIPGSSWINIATTNPDSYTISGLNANTKYQMQISAKCGSSFTAFSPKIVSTTNVCHVPLELSADSITSSSAFITWNAQCGTFNYQLKWKAADNLVWNTVTGITSPEYYLAGLDPSTEYDVTVKAVCGAFTTAESIPLNFTTLNTQRPNIVVILTDDSRYDQYRINGGPDYLELPAIERIANEGVNFQLGTVTTPLCTPSRAILFTGLYATSNGVTHNGDAINPGIKSISEILHDDGYYTAFVGKYGVGLGDPIGYDNWVVSSSLSYIDPTYSYNGIDTLFPGNILEVFPDLCIQFLDAKPADQPFMLMFGHRAPHDSITVLPEDALLFEDEIIPFPDNFYKYPNDFPSYYNKHQMKWQPDSLETIEIKREEYRALVGVDKGVQQILDWLELNGQLDNTLIIYTSDNGFMEGEHLLDNKGTALKESMILPFFMRYPDWFDGQVITDEIATMMDIPKTILELVGIPDTFGMQGLSLNALANGTAHRDMLLHQMASVDILPTIRSVRSLNYLYAFHFCDETVEEFFNLDIDPDENINQIFNPAYAGLIDEYRLILDSLRNAINDTMPIALSDCYMVHHDPRLGQMTDQTDAVGLSHLFVYPVPATDMINIEINVGIELADIGIMDMQGNWITQFQNVQFTNGLAHINIARLPAGNYQLILQVDTGMFAYQIQKLQN